MEEKTMHELKASFMSVKTKQETSNLYSLSSLDIVWVHSSPEITNFRNPWIQLYHGMILFLTLKTFLTLYTLTSVCIFSILFTYLSKEADKENLFNCQELLKLVIISSILMTSMFDSGGIQ